MPGHKHALRAGSGLKSRGFVKLADFGITGKVDDLDEAALFGTVSYFSPEQIRIGMIDSDPLHNPVWQQGDMWALGLTLAQLFVTWSDLSERYAVYRNAADFSWRSIGVIFIGIHGHQNEAPRSTMVFSMRLFVDS